MLDLVVLGVSFFLALIFMWRGTYRSWFAFWGLLFSFIITLVLFNACQGMMSIFPSHWQPSKHGIYLVMMSFLLWFIQKVLVLYFTPFGKLPRLPQRVNYLVSFIINYVIFLMLTSWLVIALTLTQYRLIVLGDKMCVEAVEFTYDRQSFILDTFVPVFFRKPVELDILDLPKAINPKKEAEEAAKKKEKKKNNPDSGKRVRGS